jgi:DNA-binding MarR family transcriptional regulator
VEAPPDAVVDALLTSARALVGMAIQTVAEGPMPVTVAQHRVLLLLDESGGLSVTDVATRLGVDQSNASRHCTRLDELGLVDRREAPADRRSVELRLSPAGRRQVRAVREARRRWARAVLTRLDSDEIGPLVASLATFAAAADSVHPDSPAPLL